MEGIGLGIIASVQRKVQTIVPRSCTRCFTGICATIRLPLVSWKVMPRCSTSSRCSQKWTSTAR